MSKIKSYMEDILLIDENFKKGFKSLTKLNNNLEIIIQTFKDLLDKNDNIKYIFNDELIQTFNIFYINFKKLQDRFNFYYEDKVIEIKEMFDCQED